MKGQHFKVKNTGKSPIVSGANRHTATGAVVPAAYAQQIDVVNRIHNKVMHIKAKRGWK